MTNTDHKDIEALVEKYCTEPQSYKVDSDIVQLVLNAIQQQPCSSTLWICIIRLAFLFHNDLAELHEWEIYYHQCISELRDCWNPEDKAKIHSYASMLYRDAEDYDAETSTIFEAYQLAPQNIDILVDYYHHGLHKSWRSMLELLEKLQQLNPDDNLQNLIYYHQGILHVAQISKKINLANRAVRETLELLNRLDPDSFWYKHLSRRMEEVKSLFNLSGE